MIRTFLVLLFPLMIHATHVGNPAQPSFYSEGVFYAKGHWSLRGGFLYENIYKGRYEDKYETITTSYLDTKLQTDGGLVALNYRKRIDLYGMVGGSKLEVDDTIFTHRNLSYSGGIKAILFRFSDIYLGIDGKYFRSKNKTDYFIIDKEVYTIVSNNHYYIYDEWQASLGASYIITPFIPYIGLTYLYSEITPDPQVGLIKTPEGSVEKFQDSVSKTKRNWGMILGVSFINKEKISLNLETRFFDQNSVGIAGEIKF